MYRDVQVTHTELREYAESAIQTIIGHFGQEITSEDESAAATAPLIDATCAQQDAIAVMTALRGYGGLNFSTACEVLIRDFSKMGENKVTRLMRIASCGETLHTCDFNSAAAHLQRKCLKHVKGFGLYRVFIAYIFQKHKANRLFFFCFKLAAHRVIKMV